MLWPVPRVYFAHSNGCPLHCFSLLQYYFQLEKRCSGKAALQLAACVFLPLQTLYVYSREGYRTQQENICEMPWHSIEKALTEGTNLAKFISTLLVWQDPATCLYTTHTQISLSREVSGLLQSEKSLRRNRCEYRNKGLGQCRERQFSDAVGVICSNTGRYSATYCNLETYLKFYEVTQWWNGKFGLE